MPTHCPHCNSKISAAIGAANYYENTVVEHLCAGCGRLFCIGDRRTSPQPNVSSEQGPRPPKNQSSERLDQELRIAAQQSGNRKYLN